MGIELNPSGLTILSNPLGFFLIFSFPIMIFVAFLASALVDPVLALARKSERLGRLLDIAIEKGPHEGWSGYVAAAAMAFFLFGVALWVYLSMGG